MQVLKSHIQALKTNSIKPQLIFLLKHLLVTKQIVLRTRYQTMFDMPHVFFSKITFSIAFFTSMSSVNTTLASIILGISLILFVQATNLLRKGKTSIQFN